MIPSPFIAALAATIALCPAAGQAADFTATSKAFASGTVQPAQFSAVMGCTGGNLSPDIEWSHPPKGTKSFVVTVYDKDAPTGSGWWHWVVIDLPADATGLAEGAGSGKADLPKGARMTPTDMGAPGFLGACPPGQEPGEAPANHSNLVVFDEEPLPAGVALYAQMALKALAG